STGTPNVNRLRRGNGLAVGRGRRLRRGRRGLLPGRGRGVVIGRHDVNALARQGEGVLDVDARQAVARHHGPVVAPDVGVIPAQVNHGLDGEHQALFQAEVVLADVAIDEVRHLRVLVHDPANAVADVVLHHTEARGLGVLLHPRGYFRPPLAPP